MDAVIYTRISKDRTGAGLGVDRQEQDCRDLAERLGLAVVAEPFQDNDLSAYSGKRRPGYEAMCAHLAANPGTVVLAWHTDRLHRRSAHLEPFIDLCVEHNISVQTVQAGTLDLASASGQMTAKIVAAVNQHEIDHARERMVRAKEQARAQGKWLGGRRPYGLEADGITVRPCEAAKVIEAADGLLAGRSLRSMAAEFGMVSTSKKATPVDAVALRRILQNGATAKILDPATHARVVALLADPSRKTTTTPDRKWLLSGIATCSVCNQTLHAHSGSGRARSYTCQGKHVARDLAQVDRKVLEAVAKRLTDPDLGGLLPYSAPETIEADQAELAKVRDDLLELASAQGQGFISVAQMVQSSKILYAREKALEAKVASQYAAKPLGALAATYDPSAAFMASTLDLQRQVVALLCTVTIKPGRRGRPKGWVPGMPYADMESVVIAWRGSEES